MTLGERVRQLRTLQAMSQRDLALKARLTQATLSRIESGITRSPSSWKVCRIAAALRVPIDLLLVRTEEPNTPPTP